MENYIVMSVSPDLQVANVKYNVQKIKEKIDLAAAKRAQIVLFPRLCLCGVSCGDLFLQPTLIEKCLVGLKTLVDYSYAKRSACVVGLPLSIGDKLYDVAVVFRNGKILGVVPNACLSVDDARYFSTMDGEKILSLLGERVPCGATLKIRLSGKQTSVLIGAETDKLLPFGEQLKEEGAQVLLHLASYTEKVGQNAFLGRVAKSMSSDGAIYLSSNPAWGESTSTDVYSGRKYYAENGGLYAQTAAFSQSNLTVDVASQEEEIYVPTAQEKPLSPTPFLPDTDEVETCRLILDIQAHALAKRIAHAHAKTAVIGVSGGLDSTLALIVLERAFEILKKDKKEIVGVTMPGFGTTDKTFQNSLSLIDGIGATKKTIDIQKSVLQHFEDIGHDKNVLNTTYENAQARMRTLILMDLANATGGIVVGTGDLSEAALGWCTYNGDHMSMYSVNATLPKTLVRKVVEVAARYAKPVVRERLISVLNTEISPELLPPSKEGEIAQKTEELVGPYDLLDFFLYYAIKERKTPEQTYSLAMQAFDKKYDAQTIKKWLKNFYKRFFTQQFKRSCAPDGANIGILSLSPKYWQMPSDACADLWLNEVEKL